VRCSAGLIASWLIIRLIIQTIRQAPSGSGASEDAPNASGADPSEADQIDAQHQSCNPLVVQVGGGGGIRTRPRLVSLPEVGCVDALWPVVLAYRPRPLVPAEDQRFSMPCGPSTDQGHEIAASLGSIVGLLAVRQ
jgi:hypothetical protein